MGVRVIIAVFSVVSVLLSFLCSILKMERNVIKKENEHV